MSILSDEEPNGEMLYPPGTSVQLRSGGPVLTAEHTQPNLAVSVVYYNNITGLFERFLVKQVCIRHAANIPVSPENFNQPRTPIKSSLS